MINTPYWLDQITDKQYPSLEENIEVDVAIVGGGITGLTTAYLLLNQELKIAILEGDKIMHGTTGYTTAKVTSQHGLIYDQLIQKYGLEKAKLYAQSNEYAIDFIEEQVKRYNIPCDFKRLPAFVFTREDHYVNNIQKEVDAAKKVGVQATLETQLNLPFSIKAAVRFDRQGQFHPTRYLLGLLSQIDPHCAIYEKTLITDLEVASPNILTTKNKNTIKAKHVIIASHFPFYDGLGFYFARLIPKKSYIVAGKANIPLGEGMYINAEQPTRSLRTQPTDDGELLLIAGDTHKTGQSQDHESHYEALAAFGRKEFELENVDYRWSTEDYSTVDDLPMIGQLSSQTENIYVGTGYAKWGMSTGTLAGMILSDLILGRDNPWIELYKPTRATLSESALNFINHNLTVAYELIKGKLKRGNKEIDLQVNEASIVTLEGKKYGAYKDKDGLLHIVDITCPHMGCELAWNNGDLTWDCPCHGSRFTYTGQIVEGPAHYNLKHYQDNENNNIDPNIL